MTNFGYIYNTMNGEKRDNKITLFMERGPSFYRMERHHTIRIATHDTNRFTQYEVILQYTFN